MQRISEPIRRWEWAALVGILLLAAALRLGWPGITEFKRDEANMSRRALDLVQGRDVPLLGLSSSVNVPNPPISVYLFALPYALKNDPVWATLFVGVLNVIAVGLTWGLARRYYGSLAAITAGLLYAAAPWAAIYSRKIWAQDMLPPFVVAVVFTGLLGFGDRKRWAQWLHWPLLALTVQIHYAAFTLIPLSLVMIVTWRKHVAWRSLALAAGIAVLTFLPAGIGAYRDGWLSLHTLRDGLSANPDHHKVFSTTALDYAWFTVAGTDIHSLAGPEQFRAYLDSVPDAYPVFKLVPLAAVLAALGLVVRRTRRLPDGVLVAWLVLPVLLFTWEWTEVAPHYFIPLMPAAYVLCGVGFEALWQAGRTPRVRRAILAGGSALIVVIAGLQIYLFGALLHFLDTHATPGAFGTPLHDLLAVRAAILDQHPDDVIVVSAEETAPYDEIPAVWDVLLDRVPNVRFVNGTRTAVIPDHSALELIAWSPALRTCPDQACAQESGARTFALRPGENPYILRVAQPDQAIPPITPLEPVRFANGAYLTGYAVSTSDVALAWTLSGPAAADYQVFVHALDASGNRLDQRDRPAWPGRYWRAGDTLILWFDLTLPPGTVTLNAGMYTLDGSTYDVVEVLDAAGAYLAQNAVIPLPTP